MKPTTTAATVAKTPVPKSFTLTTGPPAAMPVLLPVALVLVALALAEVAVEVPVVVKPDTVYGPNVILACWQPARYWLTWV